jgi:predicted aconitase with swiveling domain
MITATVLNPGEAEGPVLLLDEPLSFWGGFDPATGRIIDVHHPQYGISLASAILLMREAKGSGSAPGAIAEAIRLGSAPAAIILIEADVNLAIGAAVASELYGKHCPVLKVNEQDFAALRVQSRLTIQTDGSLSPA